MTSRTSLRSYLLTTSLPFFLFFFFNDTATTEIYTLSLHDALPISIKVPDVRRVFPFLRPFAHRRRGFLGHGFLEHSGLHALRAQPARPDGWPGARSSRNDDVLFLYWNCGYLGHAHHLRRSAVGPRRSSFQAREPLGRRSGYDRLVDGHTQCQRRRQRRFSRKRFLESFSAPHQLSHRRADYLRDGHRHAAVEAAG